MTRGEILEALRPVLDEATYGRFHGIADAKEEDVLYELGFDSIDVLEAISGVEKALGVGFTSEEEKTLMSYTSPAKVADLIGVIEAKLKQKYQ